MALNFTAVFVSSFTVLLGNFSHTLGTATRQRFEASGSSLVSVGYYRMAEGVTNCPAPLWESGLITALLRHSDTSIRGVHRVLASPGCSRAILGLGPLLFSSSKGYLAASSSERLWGGGCLALLSRMDPEA